MKAIHQPSARSKPAWYGERAALLRRLCRRLHDARGRGEPIRKATRRLTRPLRGKFYRTTPDRRIQVSADLLLHTYYSWRKNPGSDEAFRLKYVAPPRKTLPTELAAEFIRRCITEPLRPALRIYSALEHEHRTGITLPGIDPDQSFPSSDSFYRRMTPDLLSYRQKRQEIATLSRKLDQVEDELVRQIQTIIP